MTKEQALEILKKEGYTVTAPKVEYKPTKLEYKHSSVPAIAEHFKLGRKVRINFGKFKGHFISETFSTPEEFSEWFKNNPIRKKYGKSFSLL